MMLQTLRARWAPHGRRLRRAGGELAHTLGTAGWPGAVGAGLVAFALCADFTGTEPMRERLAAVEAERAELAATRAKPATKAPTPRERLNTFYERFPPADGLPDVLITLHETAREHEIQARRADYREQRDAGGRLVRVRVTIPAQGRYDNLRAWLADLLEAVPGAALDSIALRRQNVGSEQVDAELKLSVFLRSDS